VKVKQESFLPSSAEKIFAPKSSRVSSAGLPGPSLRIRAKIVQNRANPGTLRQKTGHQEKQRFIQLGIPKILIYCFWSLNRLKIGNQFSMTTIFSFLAR
jgi:hypothetical protein